MSDKIVKSEVEVWISRGFSEHTVIVGKGRKVDFHQYRLELDLTAKSDASISEGLRASGRVGRDIFLVGPALASDDVKGRADLLRTIRDMPVPQLRAMVNAAMFASSDVSAATNDRDDLIAVIMANCSLVGRV